MKLYEFVARIECAVVIAAPDEDTARKEIETWERAWFQTGELKGVVDVDLVDVRLAPKTRNGLRDVAHVVLASPTRSAGRVIDGEEWSEVPNANL